MPDSEKPKETEGSSGQLYHRLEGSEWRPAQGARNIGPADPNETLKVSVCVRPRPGSPELPDHAHWMATPPGKRRFLSVEEFGAKHGAGQQDLDAIARFAESHGLEVVDSSVPCRTVVLSGTADQLSRAFAVELRRYQGPRGAYRGFEGTVGLPEELAGVVTAVFGLDNRRLGRQNNGGDPSGYAPFIFGPSSVAQIYNFPPVPANINKQTIAVMEFLGGYGQTDINTTFANWGVSPVPTPTSVNVSGMNNYGANPQLDTEPMLDICVAGAVAPGVAIRVYWGSDETSANDWLDVVNAIIKDADLISVVTNSLVLADGDDSLVGSTLVTTLSGKFQALGTMGITVFSACGDDGARSSTTDGNVHVQYPGSDPWVTSCGGTTLSVGSTPPNMEWVWNDSTGATGGGVSALFTTLPDWQVGVVSQKMLKTNAVGRGVPDVAGNASINTGYPVVVDVGLGGMSESVNLCGTSAVAPLYGGLMAIINATLGQNVGFLNPTLYAFRDTVCQDINDQIYPGSPQDNSVPAGMNAAGTSLPPVTGYPSGPGWDACTGLGTIDGGALLAALQSVYRKDCQFILDRTEIGQDEVEATLTTTQPGVIANAFYVVVDGFDAAALGIVASDLTGTPAHNPTFTVSVAGISVVPTALLAEDTSLPPQPQRFTWVCEAQFDTASTPPQAFQPPPALPKPVTLSALMGGLTSPPVTIQLIANADPYELDGPTWWLSEDLRVFQVTTGGSLQGLPTVTLQQTAGGPRVDAPTFIKAVIAGFNADTTPPPNHPFDLISTDEQVSQVTLNEFNPSDSTTPVYNFGVARVRYQSTVASGKLRVFFRIFQAATTSTAYASDTYGSVSNSGVSMSGLIPVFGVDGANNVVAIPCFAEARVLDPTTLDQQTDDRNVALAGIPPASGGGVAYMYFGCWLDINQPAVTNAVPKSPVSADSANPWATGSQSVLDATSGKHQCLIAEISYDLDHVQPGETPASSDKLAQRNLAVVPSGNPGGPLAHRIPHTFDIRPTPATLPAGAPPDELMILWGNIPAGSLATIYLPEVNAADVLDLAAKIYTSRQLEFVDDHTLQCPTGGVTWMPIPQGTGANFAGLLTVDLPPTVRSGEGYTVVVRQVTDQTLVAGGPNALTSSAPAGNGARAISSAGERRVLGSFQISISVSAEEALLDSEESLLSIMRWIKQAKAPADRWSPVLDRYVAQIAERVQGFGGDPQKIPASPTGDWYRPPAGCGSLVVTFVDNAGGPVDDIADVFLQQLNLPDRREIRRWPTAVPLTVRDLLSADTGIYELQALPDHHKAVGRFVTIQDGQVTRVTLTLEPK